MTIWTRQRYEQLYGVLEGVRTELIGGQVVVGVPSENDVHAIRRWSGLPADETPLCGAASFKRTIYSEAVTCAACKVLFGLELP